MSVETPVGPLPTNTAVPPLAIPTHPTLVGVHLFAQALVVDPSLGSLIPIATSDALDIGIGQ